MTEQSTGKDNPEARKAYLAGDTVKLKSPEFHYGDPYGTALVHQAIPLVDFLVQIKDSGVERTNPVIAEFSSDRGGREMEFAKVWDFQLQLAAQDLAHAAGLNITFFKVMYPKFQCPEKFKGYIDSLQLPSALKTRIDARKQEIIAELDNTVESKAPEGKQPHIDDKLRDLWMKLRHPGSRNIDAPKLGSQVTEPDFSLQVSIDYDTKCYGPDYQRDTWSYQRLNHKISLVTPQTEQDTKS